jgi:predicted nucleic acid-binding protein
VSRIVVADTSPLLYLYLIGQIELLKSLFVEVHIPSAVFNEMCHTAAPETLRKWALSRPDWVNVHPDPELADAETVRLDSGERAAIALAERLTANLLLIDHRRGVRVAMSKGFDVTGTLGILDRAARRGLIDLADCVQRLKGTNFRYSPEILSRLLK